MNDNGITRIAGRVFTAFTCRRHVMEGGFGYDNADSGIAVFDYRYYLLFWCYPKDDGVRFVYTRKADDAFERLYWDREGLGDVGRKINEYFRERPRSRSVRNFKVLIWNNILKNKMRDFGDSRFLVGKRETKTYDEARDFLTKDWNISLKDFYNVFGGESSADMKFSCCGMDFEVNDSSLDRDAIERKMNEVKSKLPSDFAGKLLYGNVELKKKFHDNTLADYNPSDDMIRIDESDSFVSSMIHELGHRWHYKFCTREQEKKLMRLYNLCKKDTDNDIELHVGDIVEFRSGLPRIWEIVDENNLFYKARFEGSTDEPQWYRKHNFQSKRVKSINGKPVEHYELPRYYAGKNFREFIACCFEHVYAGLSIADKVKKEFIEIVEG